MAESLFGLVIHQLRKPGAPFLFGIGPAVLDMATSQSSYNAPEYLMTFLCQIEMARWLDLPNWGYGGTSDSQVVDAQAGMEIAELALLCLAAGSNLNHDVGYLDFGLTASLELIVIVDEYIAMNRKLFAGVEVTPETLAVDVVARRRPRRRLPRPPPHRQERAQGAVAPDDPQPPGPRALAGRGRARPARRKPASRRCKLLETHEPAPLPAELAARIDALVAGFTPGDGAAAARARLRGRGLSHGRSHLLSHGRRQSRDLRGRAGDHEHHRPARASPRGA